MRQTSTRAALTKKLSGEAHFSNSERFKSVLTVVGIALVAYALSIFFFAPRYALWNGLHVEQASIAPEVNRAIDSVAQLNEPLRRITHTSNIVLQWRLFFPLLGHLLHLPVLLYLAIPQIGCLVTLVYVALLSRQLVRNNRQVFYVTTLAATTSWFFVSTGWLSYEDSWNIFGLLLVTFSRSRAVLVTTCLYEPFIDERFILAIPLVLVLRLILVPPIESPATSPATSPAKSPAESPAESEWRKRLINDAIVILAPIAPYVLLRLVILSHDHGSLEYLDKRLTELRDPVSVTQYLLGFWMGLRLLWLGVLGLFLVLFSPRRALTGVLLLLSLAFTIAIALVIAADLSRSMSMMLPAGVVGTLLLIKRFPQQMNFCLPAMMIGNLLLPACHVVTLFNQPIFYLYASINEYVHPPPIVNAEEYARDGEVAALDGKFADAVKLLNSSVQLDPNSIRTLTARALSKNALNDYTGAMADAEAALRLDPKSADAVYTEQIILAKHRAAELKATSQR